VLQIQATQLQRQRRGGNALSNVRFFPKPGPKLYMAGVWWAFGLYALFLAKAPFTPSLEAEQFYSESIFSDISADAREAEQMYVAASRRLDAVHVFGWRWRPPYDQQVPLRKEELAHAQARYDAAVREHNALRSEAKAAVGIWSQYGVDEVRERFWKAYQSGKDFAKRMTFWDVMFGVGGRGRDEELAATVIRWLGQIMMNFTVGLISALFTFMFSLVSMLWEYKVSYLSGILFFGVAMTGASAMVATFIGGMYATAAGGLYMAIQASNNNARLEGGRGARRQHVRYNAPRYDHVD